jgi:glycosyltransferase involved in cell wall biosynthesis
MDIVQELQAMNLTPFVSVIVPVFNDSERLKICLRALEDQRYPKHLYEVIVVDNGSEDSVVTVVAEFGQARASYEGRPGSYAARNRGLALARGEVLAFTDADCIPAADWIEKGVANLLHEPHCGLVAGRVNVFPQDPSRPTAVELYESRTALLQKEYVEVGGFGATANVFTRKVVFERVGLFDRDLKSGGDIEWSRRVSSYGYRLVYADDVCVAHPARRSFEQLYRKVTRVIGGVHDLRCRNVKDSHSRIGKGFLVDSLPPVRASLRVLRDPGIPSIYSKVKLISVMFFVQYAQVWETVRLQLGAGPKR